MKDKNILLMLSGSIAAYKACDVISHLKKLNFNIRCATSNSLSKFIGISTLEGLSGTPVFYDEYETGRNMDHINLMRWADLVLACPASAQTINAFASGTGGILTTLFLAHDFSKPFLVYPAMNQAMLQHPRTQESIQYLRKIGLTIKQSPKGELACGEEGFGRLQEPHIIIEDILEELK